MKSLSYHVPLSWPSNQLVN